MVKAVLFDFGGVLAEEGFREGLRAIARWAGLDPDGFFAAADELIASTGYLTGENVEAAFWQAVRKKTGVKARDGQMREAVLSRFTLREEVLEYVKKVREAGLVAGILSDQTDWLDELDAKAPFYGLFDRVFNSYKMKKSKRDPSVFHDVCESLGLEPGEVLFIDDRIPNIQRALRAGMKALHFRDMECFRHGMRKRLGIGEPAGRA